MTEADQIRAIAELDGIIPFWHEGNKSWCAGLTTDSHISFKPYFTSYDAIIPLIQKQDDETKIKFMTKICMIYADVIGCDPDDVSSGWALTSLPISDICEALLRATGKWKE